MATYLLWKTCYRYHAALRSGIGLLGIRPCDNLCGFRTTSRRFRIVFSAYIPPLADMGKRVRALSGPLIPLTRCTEIISARGKELCRLIEEKPLQAWHFLSVACDRRPFEQLESQ